MVSEWCNPKVALRAGFDMDFYLNHRGNGYSTLLRDYEDPSGEDNSYFRKDGKGDIRRFLDQYMDWYEDTKDTGYISMFTCNHDTFRPRYSLDYKELKLAYAFLFTMPGVPFLYYGDEIGMRYLQLPTKEGGYTRTGSRTPMQWNSGKNLGFSEGCQDSLYLPVDPAQDAPTVEAQERDPASLLNTVKAILALRQEQPDLQADANLEIIIGKKEQPLVYRRGQILVALNPSGENAAVKADVTGKEIIFSIGGGELADGQIRLDAQSFLIMK